MDTAVACFTGAGSCGKGQGRATAELAGFGLVCGIPAQHTPSVHLQDKIIPFERLADWRKARREEGKTIVVTNGCFDLLHAGHVTYLAEAASHGDILLVGVNDDVGVRELKGDSRPLNHEQDRALVLAGLESVGAACIFHGSTATEFLKLAQPDVYVKGGDYTVETLNAEDRSIVQAVGGKFVFILFLEGRSTTKIVNKMTS